METNTNTTPFVIADAYRLGQNDGFRAGLVIGAAAVLLVKVASRKQSKGRYWIWRRDDV